MKKIIIRNNQNVIIGENEKQDSELQEFLDKLNSGNSPYGKAGEFQIEVVDITAEVEAERVKKETKHTDRIARVGSLKAIDWTLVTTFADLKQIVRQLVKESIKDDE